MFTCSTCSCVAGLLGLRHRAGRCGGPPCPVGFSVHWHSPRQNEELKRAIALESLLEDHNEKEPVECVCGVLVTYEAVFQPASGLGSRGLARRKERERRAHSCDWPGL